MLVNSCYRIIQDCLQTVRSVLNRITELFLKIFCLKPETQPDPIDNSVVDLTKEGSPNIFEKQGQLIRQKSLIESHVRAKGLNNQFDTHHTVEKIADSFVKSAESQADFKTPLALLEKLAWNIAQILGHESYFAPTNSVLLNKSKDSEICDGEIKLRRFIQDIPSVASYQTDSGIILRNNENQLNEESFDDIFTLALIYGMYDSHNHNILLKKGRPVFFDNPRILPPTNEFMSNCFGYMFPFRLELMGYSEASQALSAKLKERILNQVNGTLSRIDNLKSYLNDPLIQAQFEDLPISWFDADKSVSALEERLAIMKQMLQYDNSITYNDFIYAIYPKVKLYAALVFQCMVKTYSTISCERALADIGYKSLSDCFKVEEKVSKVKIPQFDLSDSLEDIYKKAKSGPYAEYLRDNLDKDFSTENLNKAISEDHPNYKLYAALVFQRRLAKNSNYSFEEISYYLDKFSLNESFKITKPVQKVTIAQFEPSDTFEDIFRKTKEGPHKEYSKDSIENDFMDKAEVNVIEDAVPITLICPHLAKSFDSNFKFSPSGLYQVNGIPYRVNQYFIPGEFIFSHKGAYLPPMPMSEFKQWLMDGKMPKAQAEAIQDIDALGCGVIHFVTGKEQFSLISRIRNNHSIYIQRRYGKKFVIKRVHRDHAGNLTIEPIAKLKYIPDSNPLPVPKTLKHEDAVITHSSVPGYYIAILNSVVLPPMQEEELMNWFASDRAEYHRLNKYNEHGVLSYSKQTIDSGLSMFVDGDTALYQINDTSPVQHIFCECVGKEIFTYQVSERGNSVGYKKDGNWVELFKL